jgi:hypothetical protein
MKKKQQGPSAKNVIKTGLITLSCVCLYSFKGLVAIAATLPISVRLVRAVELTVSRSLDFGTLAVTLNGAGEAKLDTGLNQLKVSGGGSLSLAGGTPNVGRLAIRGATYPVTISMESASVQLTNGSDQITIQDFNMMTSNMGHRVTITPQAGHNTITIPVGATLNTKAGQLTGTYTGSTRIFASFQ